MKRRRVLSLLICLMMLISLMPVFELPAAAAEFDYAVATDPTNQNTGSSWTPSDVTNYINSSTLNDDASLGNQLYYLKDGNYYPVDVVDDPEFYYQAYSGNSLDVYGNFTKDSPGTGYKTWGHVSQAEGSGDRAYYYDVGNEDMRKLYYNQEGDAGTWRITVFFYTNYEDKESAEDAGQTVVEYVKSTRGSSATWDAVRNQNAVTILKTDGTTSQRFDMRNSYDPANSHDEWTMYWWTLLVGHSSNNYEGTGSKKLYFKDTDSSKKAIIYKDEDGTQLGFVKRNRLKNDTTATSPGNPNYTGALYYKRDLSQVPISNPEIPDDPTPGGEGTIVNPGIAGEDGAGFKLTKALNQNAQGSYDLKMQSYSTANTVKIGRVEKVPTDFVVVVDQSGSMSTEDMATGYEEVSGTKTLEECVSGNYYIKDGDRYYRVYATKDYLMEYHPAESKWTQNIINEAGYDLDWFQREDEASFTLDNQYYYKTSDGVYRPINVTATGKVGTYYIKFYYNDANGNKVYFTRPSKPVYKNVFGSGKYTMNSLGYSGVNAAVVTAYPDKNAYTYSEFLGVTTGMYINYPMYTRHVGYSKLCYRDVDGVEHVIGPSNGGEANAEYCNSSGQAVTTAGGSERMSYSSLYQATGTESRLDALKGALTSFVQAVASETDTRNGGDQPAVAVDNRIAIVGFSSLNDSWYDYDNTEILTGENLTISNNNGVYYENASDSDYKTALVSAADSTGSGVNTKLSQAIEAVTAYGGTQPEYGFKMAKNILDKRTKTTYQMVSTDETVQRNKIVIFFTDGQPGDYTESNQYTEANDVVEAALPLKDDGAKIFSIGVFGESDGNPLTYSDRTATSESKTKEWKYLGGWMETYYDRYEGVYHCLRRQWRPAGASATDNYTDTANDTIYDYMSVTSSNYPNAEDFIAPTWLSGGFNASGGYTAATDGVRHKETATATNQFYRMAASQATLKEAFQQSVSYASTQQQHADVVNLDTTAVFHDEINTADFDITNATYSVTWQPIHVTGTPGAADNKVEDWDGNSEFPVVTAVENAPVPESGIIDYHGFDYGANFVTNVKTEGYKLVVTVTGLVPTRYNETLKSNADKVVDGKDVYACGIYQYGSDEAAYSVASPTLLVPLVEPSNGDMVVTKDLDPAADGSYTITMKAYAKGNFDSSANKLDKDGYLLDTINLDNLAIKDGMDQPIVRVYTLKGTAADDQSPTFEDLNDKEEITESVDVTYDSASGELKVYGFDFVANYIGNPKPINVQEGTGRNQGKELIVTIEGLVPIHSGDDQASNGDAGVYNKDDVLIQSVDSEHFSIPDSASKTYVIDFSAPMKVAIDTTSMTQITRKDGEQNGMFSLIGTDVIYQLDGSPSSRNLIMSGVDQAFVYGKLVNEEGATVKWSTITAVPASSVYFDDDFATLENPLKVGNGSGYNDGVSVTPAEDAVEKGTYTFTFNGTGIDIYCTTEDSAGFVQAKLDNDNSKIITVRNHSIIERYNVPSVSFTGLTHGEHTVLLNVLGTSNYKLDGIRVYGAIDDQTVYEDTSEKFATYISMRETLVNNASSYEAFSNTTERAVIGSLFIDDSSKLSEMRQQIDNEGNPMVDDNGDPIMVKVYESEFDAYQNNSPKNEIYLDENQAITFQLTEAGINAAASGNLWIGLSAPDAGKETGTITLKDGETISVDSGVDMYYPITSEMLGNEGSVTISNTGKNLVSVTNLKITGNESIYNAAKAAETSVASLQSSDDVIPMLFAPVTLRSVKLAANNGVDPDATAEDTPADPGSSDGTDVTDDSGSSDNNGDNGTVVNPDSGSSNGGNQQASIIKALIQSISKSISKLFSRFFHR